jgi:transposase
MANPHAIPIVLSEADRGRLQGWVRRRKTGQALATRARVVLACAEPGSTNGGVAAALGVSRPTVALWRRRFAERGPEGLLDEPRPGAPRKITDEQVERAITATLEAAPADATHWSTRSLARATGLSQTAVCRIWRAFALKPHRTETFKLSTDPLFVEKVRDIVGLYLCRPTAPWCCAWTRSRGSRPSSGPRRCCRCAPASPSAGPTTTGGTAPSTCSPPSTRRPGR